MTTQSNKSPLEALSVDQWDALIISIVKRYYASAHKNHIIDIDDLKQEAWTALMRACKNYDPEKAAISNVKFSTYAYAYIEGQLLRYMSNAFKAPSSMDITDMPVKYESQLVDQTTVDTEEKRMWSDFALTIFDMAKHEKHYNILTDHFVHGKTYREIAKELGVTHALIGQRIHAMLERAQEELSDDNY